MKTLLKNNQCAEEILELLYEHHESIDVREPNDVTDLLNKHQESKELIQQMIDVNILEREYSGIRYDSTCEEEDQNCGWFALGKATPDALYHIADERKELILVL